MFQMTLNGKPFKTKDFDKVVGEALNKQTHDFVVPQLVNFITAKVEEIKRDKNSKETGISFDASNFVDLDLMKSSPDRGRAQKTKVMQSVARELQKKGLRVTIDLNTLDIQW